MKGNIHGRREEGVAPVTRKGGRKKTAEYKETHQETLWVQEGVLAAGMGSGDRDAIPISGN